MEAVVQAKEDKRFGEALQVVNCRPRMVVGSRQAEEEAWAMAAAVVPHQEKEVMKVAEDAVRQAVALLQAQSIDIATVESMVHPFLGPYHATVDLVASADDATETEAYMVGMVVPQEHPTRRTAQATTSRPSSAIPPTVTSSCRRRWMSRWC
jgi:hypothetical protein